MFTGIVENQAKILEIEGGRFTLENSFGEDLSVGQSIAHDGACMTLEKIDEEKYTFFVMQESLDKTNFGEKRIGDFFNVERCLEVGSRIDGHFVSGHIDCVGEYVKEEKITDGSIVLTFSYPEDFSKFIIDKGSISVNGVSLTIMRNRVGNFSVSIIPHTWKHTNLGKIHVGASVNLEFDMLGKYILNRND